MVSLFIAVMVCICQAMINCLHLRITLVCNRQSPISPKYNHCCNPHQYCGGTIKLAFAAKKPELAVELAVKKEKKMTVKNNLTIRRARQTRGRAKPTCVIRYTSFRSCRAFALCIKTKIALFVSKLPTALLLFLSARLSRIAKKEPTPRLLRPQNQSFIVDRQGLEPWTP